MPAVVLHLNLTARLVDLAEEVDADLGFEVAGWVTLGFDAVEEALRVADDYRIRAAVSQTDARLVRFSGPVATLVEVLEHRRRASARAGAESEET